MAKIVDFPALKTFYNRIKAMLDTKIASTEISDWAKADTKPSYTVSEVDGALASDDISDWAKADTKPTYSASEITGIDSYALKTDLTSVYKFKGSVENYAALPTENLTVGDVYNLTDTDMNYAWTGTAWDPLGTIYSFEYVTDSDIDNMIAGTGETGDTEDTGSTGE